MRVEVIRAARRVIPAVCVVTALFVVACAESPTDQLSRAESVLEQLKTSGAEAYLKYELASARQKLEEAKKFIRKNRFELAGRYLSSLCWTLDSCNVAFTQMRRVAEQQCEKNLASLFGGIETLHSLMAGLPRQSYIDQNRYDIYTHRLRRYREEMQILQKLVAQEDFLSALQRSSRLEFQMKQALAGLIGATPTPDQRLTTQQASEKEAASLPLAASTARSSGR